MNLKPYYEQYTTSVSTREMAISMQTAETIIRFLEERRPLDLVHLLLLNMHLRLELE
jgi:hypothetical protein